MKKLLVVLGLAMAAFSFQASAATVTFNFNLGTVNDTASFSHTLNSSNLPTGKSFKDNYSFWVPANNGIIADAITSSISSLIGTLDGHVLIKSYDSLLKHYVLSGSLLGPLGAGAHTLILTGSSRGSYGGDITVAQTPIPAAIWLFGSALMGLTGISRRKLAKA
jgi:hypothetical protein